MRPVYLEGEGALTEDGRFFTEAQLQEMIAVVRRLCDWWESLSPETRAALTEEPT